MGTTKLLLNTTESYDERTILESGASLSRVYSMISRSDIEFGMITSFRKADNIPLRAKQEKNNLLLKYIRGILGDQKAYGAYRMVGHWKECSVTLPDGATLQDCSLHGGTIEDVLEESWLILNDKQSPDFFDALMKTAQHYEQDGFVARIKDNFGVFSKSGEQWESFSEVSQGTLTSSFKRLLNMQGYSELKKKRTHGQMYNFVFESTHDVIFDGICVPNPSNSSSMLFKSMNILYKPLCENNFEKTLKILQS